MKCADQQLALSWIPEKSPWRLIIDDEGAEFIETVSYYGSIIIRLVKLKTCLHHPVAYHLAWQCDRVSVSWNLSVFVPAFCELPFVLNSHNTIVNCLNS